MHGLQGVGRRTLLKRAASDYLSLRTVIEVQLLQNEGLTDLYVKLLDEARGFETRSELAQEIADFTGLTSSRQVEELARVLASLQEANEVVLLNDQGALLDEWGRYTEDATSLMTALTEHQDVYLFIVQRRRPDLVGFSPPVPMVFHQTTSLARNSIEQLLQGYLKAAGLDASSEQIRELAEYMGGYPPAVELVVTLAQQYGLPVVLADKTVLVGSLSRTFIDVIKRLKISDNGAKILKATAPFSTLPLDAISAAISVPEETVAAELRDLVDENLIEVIGGSFYAVSRLWFVQ